MKIITLLIASGLSAFALDIPRSVYTIDQLEEAKAEALEDGQPVVFLLTDPTST